jgi:hypothetical protein
VKPTSGIGTMAGCAASRDFAALNNEVASAAAIYAVIGEVAELAINNRVVNWL